MLPTGLAHLGTSQSLGVPICAMESRPCTFSCSQGRSAAPYRPHSAKPPTPNLGPSRPDGVLDTPQARALPPQRVSGALPRPLPRSRPPRRVQSVPSRASSPRRARSRCRRVPRSTRVGTSPGPAQQPRPPPGPAPLPEPTPPRPRPHSAPPLTLCASGPAADTVGVAHSCFRTLLVWCRF